MFRIINVRIGLVLFTLGWLFAVPAAASDPAPTTLTIRAWGNLPTRFLERDGAFLFVAVLDQKAPKGGVQVSMQAAGTASAGVDYALREPFTIHEGRTFSTIEGITIIDDAIQEADETIVLTATTTPALAVNELVLTVIDDDDGTIPPESDVAFLVAKTVPEQAGELVVKVAILNGAPTEGARVELQATAASTASAGDDYTLPGAVMMYGGQKVAVTSIPIVDDAIRETDETIVLTAVTTPPLTVRESSILIIDDDGGGSDEDDDDDGGGSDEDDDDGGGGSDEDDDDDGGGSDEDDDDGGGGSDEDDDGPPVVSFELEGAACDEELCRAVTGEAIRFIDASTGKVLTRRWEFGSGRTSGSAHVEHSWSSPGFYEVTLTVSDGEVVSTAALKFLVEASEPAGTCEPDAGTLCLRDSRYAVSVDRRSQDGEGGSAGVVHEGTNDSGLFAFFSRENWEILIKVLDGCAHNGYVWVYAASTTDLGYTIRVTDTVTGKVNEYRNEPGIPAPVITDATAFPEACER